MSRLLLSALGQTGEGISIVDLSGRILYVNDSFARIHGYTEEELQGAHLSIFHTPEQMPLVDSALGRVMESGAFSGEVPHAHRNGTVFHTLMHATLVRDENGQPIGISGTLRDITEMKRHIEELRDARQMLESVLDAIPDVIGIQDLHHGIVRYNLAGYRFLGIGPGEVNGRKCFELIGHSRPCGRCATTLTYRSRKPERLTKFVPEMGKWLDVRAYPVLDDEGNLTHVIEHLRDVTQLKEAEANARRLEERIRVTQKLESLGVMAGGIAHDFNNILMAVLGNTELADGLLPEDSPVRGHLQAVRDAAMRASDLAGQMLDYSGRSKPHRVQVNINRIIRETGSMLGASLSRKTRLVYRLSEDLPPVFGDSTQLLQVIMNLVTNASESHENSPGTVTISTGLRDVTREELSESVTDDNLPRGEYVELTVEDRGSGMDSDTLSRAFDPFFTTKFAGRGLGLPAVLGILRSHRGAIMVKSSPGEGSRFTVLLPVSRGEAWAEPATGAGRGMAGSGLVLIADDDEAVRTVSAKMLEKLGYTVLLASDGREAVEMYRDHPREIVCALLDLTMPVMDGAEACREILESDPGARIVVTSGFGYDSTLEQVGEGRLAGALHKPYSLDELARAVSKAARGFRDKPD
jgi:PAS domain S-box-containing protein